jgi:hypothetical protein
VRIFINEQSYTVGDDAVVADALKAFHADAVDLAKAGKGYVTDGTGCRLELDAKLTGGAILRVIGPAGRATDGDTE